MSAPNIAPAPGRRERKKAETRARIQLCALELFERNGYSGTTVEQISDAADVSTTTFFRYFRTKDDTVAHNAFVPCFLTAFDAQPYGSDPLSAVRTAVHAAAAEFDDERWAHERRRQGLVLREPELRGPSFEQVSGVAAELGRVVARLAGRATGSLEVRTFTGAVLGVLGTVILSDADTAAEHVAELDTAIHHLGAGLRF